MATMVFTPASARDWYVSFENDVPPFILTMTFPHSAEGFPTRIIGGLLHLAAILASGSSMRESMMSWSVSGRASFSFLTMNSSTMLSAGACMLKKGMSSMRAASTVWL